MNRSVVGGLLAVALLVSAFSALTCKKSSNPVGPGGGGAGDVTITIVANNGSSSFSPNPDTVTVGQKVVWHNALSASHSSTANGGAWDTGLLAPNTTSAAVTMATAGSFPYHCSLHTTMVGTLVVRP